MIRERSRLEILEQNTPWIDEAVECLLCGWRWIAQRLVGVDYRRLQCPFCGGQSSELVHEAPRFVPTRH
jgi:hypothetical protein